MARPARKRPVISNEQAFDRYRRLVETDVAGRPPILSNIGGFVLAIQSCAVWGGRYRRRRNIVEGGRDYAEALADEIARDLLSERNRRIDSQYAELPNWDSSTRSVIDASVRNTTGSPFDALHPYGPSLRRLWAEARDLGLQGDDAWTHVREWANRLPAAFARAVDHTVLDPFLQQLLDWSTAGDPFIPWNCVQHPNLQVRINDFPDEFMYALLQDGLELGAFHDWPSCWSRPGQPAEVTTAPIQVPAIRGKSRDAWLPRYRKGECEQVWTEMSALAQDIRKKEYLPAAQAVAQETMIRARKNVETLIERLHHMGYRFWQAAHGTVWQRYSQAELEEWSNLQGAGVTLSLSLAAWIEQVGSVDLCGSHPEIGLMEGEAGFDGRYSDPLMVAPDAGWTAEEWDARTDAESDIELILGWDDAGKAGLNLDSQVDVQYTMRVPCLQADGRVEHEWHNSHFVPYLRNAFRWGGFPGWERYSKRDERVLAFLTDGLWPL